MKELLSRLIRLWGAPGREEQVAAALADLVRPHAAAVSTDPLGNLLVRRGSLPGARRLLLTAHMDGPAAIVNQVTDQGLLRFAPVAGFNLIAARGQRVRFANGQIGVLDGESLDDPGELKPANSWVDIGADSRAEALALISEGDMFVLEGELIAVGGRWSGPNLDNRAGCAVLVRFLERLGDQSGWEVHLAFTVQGQPGSRPRGVCTAAYAVNPDLVVSVDVTAADRGKGAEVKLGRGPALRLRDAGHLLRPAAKEPLIAAAQRAGVQWQPEILDAGGSEAAALDRSQPVPPAAVIGLPVRYLHTPVELVDPADLEAAVDWLVALAHG